MLDKSISEETRRTAGLRTRRWKRYSLRFLALVLTCLCFAFAWIGNEIRATQRENRSIDRLRASGGFVYYDYEVDLQPAQVRFSSGRTRKSPWSERYFGDHFYDRVYAARLGKVDSSDLPAIMELRELRLLDLDGANIDRLPNLDKFPLEALFLSKTRVADISTGGNLLALKWLTLDDAPISDISTIKHCKSLEILSMCRTPVNDISVLCQCDQLVDLRLNGSLVRNLSPLRNCSRLMYLSIDDTPVTTIRSLVDNGQLVELSLNGTSLEDLSPLRDLPLLQYISLRNAIIGDVSELFGLKQAVEIDVVGSSMSRADIEMLKRECPHYVIYD